MGRSPAGDRCPGPARDRIRLPRPSGVSGLGLRRPHAHLPVAYRPRWWMQRITASGTRPSTGSPARGAGAARCWRRRTGRPGRRPPASPAGRAPAPPRDAHHRQGDQVPECGLVVPGGEPGHHVRPDHQDELGPGFVLPAAGGRCPRCRTARPGRSRCRLASSPGHPSAAASTMAKRSSAGVTGRSPSFCHGSLATTSSMPVEVQGGPDRLGQLQVGGVDRVEGPAEDADAGTGLAHR